MPCNVVFSHFVRVLLSLLDQLKVLPHYLELYDVLPQTLDLLIKDFIQGGTPLGRMPDLLHGNTSVSLSNHAGLQSIRLRLKGVLDAEFALIKLLRQLLAAQHQVRHLPFFLLLSLMSIHFIVTK